MRRRSMPFITALSVNRWVRGVALTLYYLTILVGLILLYGEGDFSTPSFVYQGF
jgi:hypothetical protein